LLLKDLIFTVIYPSLLSLP
jgi:hypothetical protein